MCFQGGKGESVFNRWEINSELKPGSLLVGLHLRVAVDILLRVCVYERSECFSVTNFHFPISFGSIATKITEGFLLLCFIRDICH